MPVRRHRPLTATVKFLADACEVVGEAENYARHHDHLMASRPAPLVTGMPSLPASRQPSGDPRTSEAIRQQVLALHDHAAVREHEVFVARTMQVMGDALASMSTFREAFGCNTITRTPD